MSPDLPPLATGSAIADVIVIPVHNRRATTLACLHTLRSQEVFAWATVLVVDDGSTDGTGAAIRHEYPETVVLPGDGTWWWGGAIRRGMEWALARGAERMYWLNDDCRPPPGGMAALREWVGDGGTVAWLSARAPGGWTYGAYLRTLWGVRRCTPAEEAAGRTETFNGNCVCVPRRWVERVGLPDSDLFPHGAADLDYGLRLHAGGAALQAVPGLTAENGDPAPATAESWLATARPMSAIWREFSSPRSYHYFPAWRRFCLRHWGPGWGWVVFVLPYARWAAIALARLAIPGAVGWLVRRRNLNSPNARAGG